MSSNNFNISQLSKFLGMGLIALLSACDVLEQDATPDGSSIKIDGSKFYTLPNNSAYIDLYSLVKTQEKVQLKVVSQPSKGAISEMGKGVLKYSPNTSFTKGSDSFRFSVLTTDNKLLRTDSVVIVVEKDSTKLPCGIYTQSDYVDAPATGSITVNVLKNDILCDSAHIALEIYNPSAFPLHGSALVIGNKIKYTPNSSFKGTDQVFYKVKSTLDSSKYNIGIVFLASKDFTLRNDTFTIRKDTLGTNTLSLYVFKNDSLPYNGGTNYTSSVISQPHHGTTTIYGTSIVFYQLTSPPAVMTDSLTYQVCKGATCKTAKAYIKIY